MPRFACWLAITLSTAAAACASLPDVAFDGNDASAASDGTTPGDDDGATADGASDIDGSGGDDAGADDASDASVQDSPSESDAPSDAMMTPCFANDAAGVACCDPTHACTAGACGANCGSCTALACTGNKSVCCEHINNGGHMTFLCVAPSGLGGCK